MAYWRLYYHVVWSTKRRDPWIVEDLPALVENAMRHRLHALDVLIHGVGIMPDHVHLALSIPPHRSIAEVVGQGKGAASFLIRQQYADPDDETSFTWQAGYGVFSLSEKALPGVLSYLANQKTHHETGDLWPGLERVDPPENERTVREVETGYESNPGERSDPPGPTR